MGACRRKGFALTLTTIGILLIFGGPAWGSIDDETDLEDEGFAGEAVSVAASSEEDELDIKYESPTATGSSVYFAENFDDVNAAKKKWVISRAHKEEEDNVFKYEGKWDFEYPVKRLFPVDQALVLKSKAKHHAISAKLSKPFEFIDKPLFVQYEVTFQNGMDCGGAYMKLLSHARDMKLETFNDRTPYTIMFGPDKCGSDIKMHFIFRHKNPINGTFSEKHSKRPSNRMEETYSDKKPHLYRLKLMPNNKYEVFVDTRLINQGSLLDDVEPSVNPPMEVEDPNDVKPADWDEREKIPDATAQKPEDWNDDAPLKIPDPKAVKPDNWLNEQSEMIPDSSAVKPEDWDESMDGSWEAPLVPNPQCETAAGCGEWIAPLVDNPNFRGKWKAPMISNPNYKGKWTRRMIPNPDYFEDKEPFKMTPIGAVGLEIWTMTDSVLFDNFIITDDEEIVEDWTSQTWELKRRVYDKDSEGVVRRLINYSNAHPWLWAIYVFVIGLPLVLFFTFCCGNSAGKEKRVNEDELLELEKRKKTDKETADHQDDPQGGGDAPVVKNSANKAAAQSKDELEQPEEEEEASEEDNEEEELQEVEKGDSEEELIETEKEETVSRRRKGRRD